MSRLVPLTIAQDVAKAAGRRMLQDSLDLIASAIANLRDELDQVKEADKIVRATPVEEFPVAAGQIYTGQETGNIGDMIWRAVSEIPSGFLECNGAAVSRTTYSDLFAKIGTSWGVGDGSTTFNLPDMRGRSPMGQGTGTGLSVRTLGQYPGAETHALVTGELPSHNHSMAHTHDLSNHTHDMGNHTHDISHTHTVRTYVNAGGATPAGVSYIGPNQVNTHDIAGATVAQSTSTSGVPSGNTTTTPGPNVTGASSAANTGSTGSGTAHANVHPTTVLACYIRYRLGPDDIIQTLPVSWGRVNAQWRLDTVKNFPTTGVNNLHNVITADLRPEAVVQIQAVGGTLAGNTSENKIVGVARLPYNFRKFESNAFRIRTKVTMTGVSGGSSATVTLKVSDPLSAGSYLATTYTRTLSESGSSIQDGAYVDAKLTSQDLGPDWKPGYLFRFELIFSVPRTFSTCDLEVGLMDLRQR